MPAPRPYGVGPYGIGAYERYRGAIYEIGAATQIAFSPCAGSYRLIAIAGLTGITFETQLNGLVRLRDVGAATQIAFDTRAQPTRVIVLHPLTEIEWVVWGELLESWTANGACATGAWPAAVPCETGVWQPVVVGKAGGWTPDAAEHGTGTWQPAADGCQPWKQAA